MHLSLGSFVEIEALAGIHVSIGWPLRTSLPRVDEAVEKVELERAGCIVESHATIPEARANIIRQLLEGPLLWSH